MEEISTDVLIIGGGVAGSAVAAALKNTDLKITIVEPRVQKDINRGDVLYPATLQILEEWGLLGRMKEKAVPFQKLRVMHKAKCIMELDLSKENPSHPQGLSIDHGIIEEVLLDFARTKLLSVMKGHTVVEVIVGKGGVHGAIVAGEGKKTLIRAKLIVGADGRNSIVREAMGIQKEQIDYDRSLIVFSMPLARPVESTVDIHVLPPNAVATQVLPGNRLRVAVDINRAKCKEWIAQSTQQKYNYLLSFSSIFTNAIPRIDGEHVYELKAGNSAHYYSGNAALVGDAAHETHPVSSQGMQMAISDAYALGKALKNSLDELPQKLPMYDAIRKPVAEKIIRHSDALAKLLSKDSFVEIQTENAIVTLLEHFSGLKKLISKELFMFEYKTMVQ